MRRLPALVLALAGATLAAAAPRAVHAQTYDEYTDARDATVDARGARRLEVEGRSGLLRIRGVDGLREVRVRGTARSSRRAWLDEIRLVARREGDAIVVRADIPDLRDGEWSDGYHVRSLDLVLEVPRGIAADVVDGSGSVEIRGVGALDLKDGSGEILVEDVASARIEDGSGEIRLRDVRGDVRVADGSGDIDVSGVRGSVAVDRDGSGEIAVREVSGDLTIDRARARGIAYTQVSGRVSVPRDERRTRRSSWY
jgi:predicted RNA-binding protein